METRPYNAKGGAVYHRLALYLGRQRTVHLLYSYLIVIVEILAI